MRGATMAELLSRLGRKGTGKSNARGHEGEEDQHSDPTIHRKLISVRNGARALLKSATRGMVAIAESLFCACDSKNARFVG